MSSRPLIASKSVDANSAVHDPPRRFLTLNHTRPAPPVADLRKATERPHNYPDLAQPPVREHFPTEPPFNEVLLRWLVNVAPTVVRRNKRRERLELKPGATAKEIADAIRARANGDASYPPSDESPSHSN